MCTEIAWLLGRERHRTSQSVFRSYQLCMSQHVSYCSLVVCHTISRSISRTQITYVNWCKWQWWTIIPNNIESDLNAGFVEPADQSADPISVNEDTRPNIRIHCHKCNVNSIDAELNTNNYYPFILSVCEQTYSVTLKQKD